MYKQDIAAQLGGRIRFTRFTISYKDLQAVPTGSGAQPVTLADQDNPLPWKFYIPNNPTALGGKILGVAVKHSISFSGGALTAMTVSLGVTGATTRFTTAFDVFQAVSDTALQETSMFKLGQYSATQLIATFTPTTDVVQNATAGSVWIDICYLDVSTTGTLPA